MKIKDNLHYSAEHLWVAPTDQAGIFNAGITDYAQDLLGDIVYVEAPQPGAELKAGEACGLVESVKTGSDLHAPLDGVVLAINTDLQGTPELINDKPYEAWIFQFKAHNADDLDKLLDAAGYQAQLGE
ncbi:glycine cleavage system protein GcvH [Methylovorus menthalis]|uniref:glycine cleavage system protein GcvH n=1 Tax=Methylovorus menthalis TaxID=1002227 RepID=UPI001E603F59|nr:glycine cleavage system protein GcvH [Methylovorus menthalis]MCB4810773.1 glycine cleavage system protein GcvH [Methylovorus menthalis]